MIFESHLRDGRRVVFRPIQPSDKEILAAGFARLSPESRYRRFFRAIDHLSQTQLEYLTEVDGQNHVAWVAVLPDEPPHLQGAGVARWIRLHEDPEVAEGAVTVVDSLHGNGIGKTLLYLVTHVAIDKGIRNVRAWVLGDNHHVQSMLSELGAKPGRWESGALEMTIPLPDDPRDLDATPVPLILKAVAAGELDGRGRPDAAGMDLAASEEAVQPIRP